MLGIQPQLSTLLLALASVSIASKWELGTKGGLGLIQLLKLWISKALL